MFSSSTSLSSSLKALLLPRETKSLPQAAEELAQKQKSEEVKVAVQEINSKMGSTSEFDPHKFTRPFQLTKTIHRGPYPTISPYNPANSKKGQIIVITGGGTGIGAVSFLFLLGNLSLVIWSLVLTMALGRSRCVVPSRRRRSHNRRPTDREIRGSSARAEEEVFVAKNIGCESRCHGAE